MEGSQGGEFLQTGSVTVVTGIDAEGSSQVSFWTEGMTPHQAVGYLTTTLDQIRAQIREAWEDGKPSHLEGPEPDDEPGEPT